MKPLEDMMNQDQSLRDHLENLLDSKGAHIDFEGAIAGLPGELRGQSARGIPYTIWQLVEHMRIAQWDILEFSRNAEHVSPRWPREYWPESSAPESDADWEKSIEGFRSNLQSMKDLVRNPDTDLVSPIPHGEGQTILRAALLVADHNAYHIGQIVLLRRILGTWPV